MVPSLRIVIRGPPRVNPPRGFGSAEGYVRRAVGALHCLCSGAAFAASAGRSPPAVQVPASLARLPRAAAPGGLCGGVGPLGRRSRRGLAADPAGGCRSPPAEGRCSPVHGPWSCRGRSCPRSGADGVELAGADDGVPGGVAGEGVDLTGTGGLSEHGPGVGAAGGPAGNHPFHRRGRRPPASCRLPRPRRGRGDPVRKPK